jgi:elongation factor G
MGDLQLEVMVDRLKKRFGVEVLLTRPRVPYRETIKGKAEDEYRHKKQTGRPRPVWRGASAAPAAQARDGFKFVDEIKGGVVPNQFIPAVEKGVIAGMEKGPLGGYPVVDVQGHCSSASITTSIHRKWRSRSRPRPASIRPC